MSTEIPVASVTLRFYEELNDFLSPARRKRDYRRTIFLSPPVKDVIEAEDVPHAEVDLVLVNGASVGFGHRLQDGDRVAVYPVFEALDVGPVQRLRSRPLREPRFVLDVHLGKLARRLRLLGFDSLYGNDWAEGAIVALATRDRRTVLTRDVGLLKRAAVTHGYWLRAVDPERQVKEVIERFDLRRRIAPFTRCIECNGTLAELPAQQAAGRVPPAVAQRFKRFYVCGGCGKVYWEGLHHARLAAWVERQARAD